MQERFVEVNVRRLSLLLTLPVLASAVPTPSVAARMHESWAKATEARDRLIAGDLAGVHAAAGALAAIGPDSELPKEWQPGAQAVRALATELAATKDLPAASEVVGRLGAACGNCHTAMGGGPDLEGEDVPAQAFAPGDNMRLHAWAVEWTWLGLVGASDAAWQRGASSLDDRPLDLRWDEKPPSDDRQQLEQLIYVLAARALETSTPADRAEVYGQLTATCAQCHTKAPPAPGAPSGPR